MIEAYQTTLFVLLTLLTLMVIQALVATAAHRKQTEYVPGIVNAELDHFSFVFRSNRTFLNSLENVPIFVLTALIAMMIGVDADQLFYASLLFLVARLIHMVLFYAIATNKNPSPRSYFYMLALLTQIYVLGVTYTSIG